MVSMVDYLGWKRINKYLETNTDDISEKILVKYFEQRWKDYRDRTGDFEPKISWKNFKNLFRRRIDA